METEVTEPRLFRLPRGWNKHHAFWPRRDYVKGVDKAFRGTNGLIIPTPVVNHNLLHARLLPPKHPTRLMMYDVEDILGSISVGEQHDRLWGIEAAQAYFKREAEILPSPQQAELAHDLSTHLSQQMGYLSLRLVERAA